MNFLHARQIGRNALLFIIAGILLLAALLVAISPVEAARKPGPTPTPTTTQTSTFFPIPTPSPTPEKTYPPGWEPTQPGIDPQN